MERHIDLLGIVQNSDHHPFEQLAHDSLSIRVSGGRCLLKRRYVAGEATNGVTLFSR